MTKCLSLAVLILLALFFTFNNSLADTGDVLFSGCQENCSDGYAGSGNGWTRTIQNSGCVSGECLKLDASYNSGNRYGGGSTRITVSSINGHDEVTIVYYVKLNPGSRSLSNGNVKGVRLYHGSSAYIFSTMDAHFSYDHYQSVTNALTLQGTDLLTKVKQNSSYCSSLGNNTYSCPVRYDLQFRTKDGSNGYPSGKWRKVRYWVKMPSSANSSDGESMLWVDEELIYRTYNVRRRSEGGNTFTSMTFFPSCEAGEPFEHWLDEMTIYEGYVPPDGSGYTPPHADDDNTDRIIPKNLRF
jgi:hypothetical protein